MQVCAYFLSVHNIYQNFGDQFGFGKFHNLADTFDTDWHPSGDLRVLSFQGSNESALL